MAEKIFKFEEPTQVAFLDMNAEEIKWTGGIAYGPNIICGCCGGIIELVDIWIDWTEWGSKDPKYVGIESPLIIYEKWVDISDNIIGC